MNKIRNIIHEALLEYSADQRLPFDDDYFKNKNYLEQYTDWLEDFGKYGTLSPSKLDFWGEVKKAIKYIFESKLYQKYNLELSIYNENELLEKLVEIIHNNLIFDENGNLYVERQVRIEGSAKHYNKSTFDNYDPKTLYNNLVDNYNNNVGGCWSYNKGGSKAYCSKEDGDIITLKGYIRTDDIDFVKTVLLNFHYPNEHEIRVKPNAKVELIEVDFDCKYKIPLKGHLIVNSTYFGNNKGYEGEYAKIDNGFGQYKIMDRKGKIIGANNDLYFDDINYYNKNLYLVRLNDKYSFIDKNGDLINNGDSWFDYADTYCTNGFGVVKLNGEYSFIDEKGNLINNGNSWFDEVDDFNGNFAAVRLNDKYSFIDKNGELINSGNLWLDSVISFYYNFFKVQLNDKYSLFNNVIGELIGNGNLWFDSIDGFKYNFSQVKLNDKYSLLNKNGELIGNGNLWFTYINPFNDEYDSTVVCNMHGGIPKFSLITKNGVLVKGGDLWLDVISLSFENGLALSMLNNKKYYIDTEGNFYDYETKQPIPSPIDNANESKKYIKNIIKETINNYLKCNLI